MPWLCPGPFWEGIDLERCGRDVCLLSHLEQNTDQDLGVRQKPQVFCGKYQVFLLDKLEIIGNMTGHFNELNAGLLWAETKGNQIQKQN